MLPPKKPASKLVISTPVGCTRRLADTSSSVTGPRVSESACTVPSSAGQGGDAAGLRRLIKSDSIVVFFCAPSNADSSVAASRSSNCIWKCTGQGCGAVSPAEHDDGPGEDPGDTPD